MDNIYMIDISDLGKLESIVDSKIKYAQENGFGKTVEAYFYTYVGADDPIGYKVT